MDEILISFNAQNPIGHLIEKTQEKIDSLTASASKDQFSNRMNRDRIQSLVSFKEALELVKNGTCSSFQIQKNVVDLVILVKP